MRTGAHLRSAQRGQELFAKLWSRQEGLGPTFNATSCAGCHARPTLGGAGPTDDALVQIAPAIADATGGHLFQRFLVKPNGGVTRRVPPQPSIVRRAPPLFGLGLLERVPRDAVEHNADPTDADADGISGRVAERFGWKARFGTLRQAVAAALNGELGLTTELFPVEDQRDRRPRRVEVSMNELDEITRFVRCLMPLRVHRENGHSRGEQIFLRIGCAGCHTPALTAEVAGAYTDLLLHDMGPALADGIEEGMATGAEFRTPPLWALSQTGPPYLHDGRARTLHEAVAAHGGEGSRAQAAYLALNVRERRELLQFLNEL